MAKSRFDRKKYFPSRNYRHDAAQTSAKGKRWITQMVICAILFMTFVLGKMFFPSQLTEFRSKASQLLNQNIDFQGALSSMGRAVAGKQSVEETLDDIYVSVFKPLQDPTSPERLSVRQGSVSTSLQCSMQEGTSLAATILQQPESAASVSQTETPLTVEAANTAAAYTYTAENLPDRVSMNQKILGISYSAPIHGRLTSGFGYRMHPLYGKELFHYGLDIAKDSGSTICAFADGTVGVVGDSNLLGKYLTIYHDNGVETLYAHCSKILAAAGATVKKGDSIAEVGSTGVSTGPHLHFEIHLNGIYLNPIYYVDTSVSS